MWPQPTCLGDKTRWHHAPQEHRLHVLHDRQTAHVSCKHGLELQITGGADGFGPFFVNVTLAQVSFAEVSSAVHFAATAFISHTVCCAFSLESQVNHRASTCDQHDLVTVCTKLCLDYLPCIELKEQVKGLLVCLLNNTLFCPSLHMHSAF